LLKNYAIGETWSSSDDFEGHSMLNLRRQRTDLPRDTFAREIAERSVAATLAQLSPIAERMSAPEQRGYVRAHALPFIRDEATQLVSREWPADAFADLVATALEQATHLVIQQLKLHPIITMPAAHVRLRLAA
jgi:hypothetical protein